MDKNISHEYVKQITADRLGAPGGSSVVLTEVNIREEGKYLGRPDIVMVRDLFRTEVFIVETKVSETEVDLKVLEQMKVYSAYANRTYLCLPKKECSPSVVSLCRRENVGLVAVNIDIDDGPVGILTVTVQSSWNPNPKKWVELSLRLEKLGLQSLYFV